MHIIFNSLYSLWYMYWSILYNSKNKKIQVFSIVTFEIQETAEDCKARYSQVGLNNQQYQGQSNHRNQ